MHPYAIGNWSSFVEDWLNTTNFSELDEFSGAGIHGAEVIGQSAKSPPEQTSLYESDARAPLYLVAMPTTPPSSSDISNDTWDTSPSKRRRLSRRGAAADADAGIPASSGSGRRERWEGEEQRGEEREQEQEDLDKTPRSHASSSCLPFHQLPCHLPQPRPPTRRHSPAPPNLISSPSTGSVTSSASRRSAGSKQRRPISPAKRTQSLEALEKPVRFVALQDNAALQLPADARQLYDRIFEITVEHHAFLPRQVRPQLCYLVGRPLRDSWFEEEEEDGGDAIDELARLRALLEIETTARECMQLGRSEGAWNLEVHAPLLKLALARRPRVCRELATTARIAAPFVPPLGGRQSGTFVESKMIDFVLLLDVDKGPVQRHIPDLATLGTPFPQEAETPTEPGDALAQAADERLARKMRDAVWSQSPDEQYLNQTTYLPLRHRPIAVSIETKAAGLAEEGRVQLGVWTAAWHRRMRAFMRSPPAEATRPAEPASAGGQQGGSVVTLPLLLIVEHEWKLFFTCDRGDFLEIVGDISIGDTKTLLGLYTVVTVLTVLADWVEGPFCTWIERVFNSLD